MRIVWLRAEMKEICVCDIADVLGVTRSAVSQHLAKFKAYGLVKPRRAAQTLYYSLSDHPFDETLKRSILAGVQIEAAGAVSGCAPGLNTLAFAKVQRPREP